MLGIKKRDTKQVFKAIAHQQGVSVSEVKERIQSTIDEMYYSDAPDVQAEFSSYFGKKRPTPEEYVYTMVNITVRQSRQSGVARATCPD